MLAGISRHQLEEAAQRLLDDKRLVLCISKGSTSKKWLDVPDGDFALGVGGNHKRRGRSLVLE